MSIGDDDHRRKCDRAQPEFYKSANVFFINLYRGTAKTSMKSSLHWSILSVVTLLLSFQTPQSGAVLANSPSFEQWCQQKDSLPIETKKTVEVMLKKAGSQDCRLADMKLNSLSSIEISDHQITNVKPLASLTNLSVLTLYRNQIIDISPLKNLTKLTELYLSNNKIKDVKPIAELPNLIHLQLDANRIVDVKPLAKLCSLTSLSLSKNQIVDVNPIAELHNLTFLTLSKNQIVDVNSIAELHNLTFLDLGLEFRLKKEKKAE